MSVKDTTAYAVVEQIIDHNWTAKHKLADDEFLSLCLAFEKSNGSWSGLMDGDIGQVVKLTTLIEDLINLKNLAKKVDGMR